MTHLLPVGAVDMCYCSLLFYFDSDVANVYNIPPLSDVTPVSGVLTYAEGARLNTFKVRSKDDIEEEGNEVFSVVLVAATGGASLSFMDSRTSLTGNVSFMTVGQSDDYK